MWKDGEGDETKWMELWALESSMNVTCSRKIAEIHLQLKINPGENERSVRPN